MLAVRAVGIVGTGLMGTSIGLAVRQRRVAERVVGVDVDPAALDAARSRGALDKGSTSYDLLREADLIVVAVPPLAVVDTIVRVAGVVQPGTVLTDVASTKREIVQALERRLPRLVRYVGGHPMAGSEREGPQAADAALLGGHPFIVTPTAVSDAAAVELVVALASGMGMHPVVLSAEDHDALVAQISHIPYLLAVAAVRTASAEARQLQGPGFAGLARLAGSPVELWAQICTANRDAIRLALARVREELDRLDGSLDHAATLRALLAEAHRRATAGGE